MNPLLETAGQIAAIIIGLFIFLFIILALVFNLAMAFGMSWLSEKVRVIKSLRPTVESLNKTTESTLQGIPPDHIENSAIRTIASVPAKMQDLKNNVEQGTDKVANAVIEFRARTVQTKTILKAFFLPGLMPQKQETAADKTDVELHSPGHQILTRERPTASPPEAPSNQGRIEQVQHAVSR